MRRAKGDNWLRVERRDGKGREGKKNWEERREERREEKRTVADRTGDETITPLLHTIYRMDVREDRGQENLYIRMGFPTCET